VRTQREAKATAVKPGRSRSSIHAARVGRRALAEARDVGESLNPPLRAKASSMPLWAVGRPK
jgi:hypothetical protein